MGKHKSFFEILFRLANVKSHFIYNLVAGDEES